MQQQVDRIRSQLPNDPNLQQPQIAKFDSNSLPVVRFYVTDPNMPLRDLGDLFANQLSDEFASVDGVANVVVGQDQQRAFMIEPDANKLAAYGMTLNQIIGRVQQENLNLPAGIVQVGPNEYQVRANALLANAAANRRISCSPSRTAASIRIGTVAKVTDSIQEQRTYERLNGKPAIGVVIDAQPNANIVATAIGTYRKIDQIQARYAGMKIGVVFDQQELHSRSDQRARAHRDLRRHPRRHHHSALPALVAHDADRRDFAADLGARHALRRLRLRLFAQHHDARRPRARGRAHRRRRDRRHRKHLPAHGARAIAAQRRRERDHRNLQRSPRVVGHRHHGVHSAGAHSGAARA